MKNAVRVFALCIIAVVAVGPTALSDTASTRPMSEAFDLVAQDSPPPDVPPVSEPAGGFRYPGVFLVPLALLVLGGVLARTLTHPIPAGTASDPDS